MTGEEYGEYRYWCQGVQVYENPAFTPDDHTIQSEKVLTMFVQQGHSLEEASKWEVKKQ